MGTGLRRRSGAVSKPVPRALMWLLPMAMLLAQILQPASALAATPVVKAVFFWSSTCPHCHTVIEQVLPPIQKRYGAQFQLKMLQMEHAENVAVYTSAVELFKIPKERTGVPALVIGQRVLVGSQEIPAQLDTEIQRGLATGGVDYPPLANLAKAPAVDMCGPTPCGPGSAAPAAPRPDPIGTGIAAGVLVAMLVALAYAVRVTMVAAPSLWADGTAVDHAEATWRSIVTPLLTVLGLGISSYLAYVEITRSAVLCGPIGNCDVVQTSAYAVLLGVPVAVWGGLAYVAVLVLWLARRMVHGHLSRLATLGLLGLLIAAVLFSVYLTLIELFVLHAICTWCVSSAIVVSLLLSIVASQVKFAIAQAGSRV